MGQIAQYHNLQWVSLAPNKIYNFACTLEIQQYSNNKRRLKYKCIFCQQTVKLKPNSQPILKIYTVKIY